MNFPSIGSLFILKFSYTSIIFPTIHSMKHGAFGIKPAEYQVRGKN